MNIIAGKILKVFRGWHLDENVSSFFIVIIF